MVVIDEPLFAEEDAAFKGVQRLFIHGPSEVVINRQGVSAKFATTKLYTLAYEIGHRNALSGFDVFIRDDGWRLAAPAELSEFAEQKYLTNWVGKVTVGRVKGQQGVLSEVFIYTDAKVVYSAGVVDRSGFIVSADTVQTKISATPESNPTSLDDMRDWLRKGCPD